MTAHLSWDTINDYADNVLAPGPERDDAAKHLDGCDECRARLDDLRGFLREANGAVSEVAPPDDVWPVVRSEIERRKVIDLPGTRRGGVAGVRGRGRTRWMLAAAAAVLVMTSSAITALVMRGSDSVQVSNSDTLSSDAVAPMLEVARVERGYLETAVELTAALEAARPQLAPETIAVVERNLGVIDAAIAESRAALLRDPGNRVLLEVLSGTYRQKLDLLRRAAQLASS
jgi:hypothetical protein